MKISIISFTAKGAALAQSVGEKLQQEMETAVYTKHRGLPDSLKAVYVEQNLSRWAGGQFQAHSALLFIGACGIAVRGIAPSVKDKLEDSPVLVMDEACRFVIPLLSGHFGGANELAERIAQMTGAVPVITTATDVNGLFAADAFARKNKLSVCNRSGIEIVSSSLLAGKTVTMAVAGTCSGSWPEELTQVPYPVDGKASVIVSPFTGDAEKADLQLCPKAYVIGIGCKRGKPFSEIEEAAEKQLRNAGIRWEALAAVTSVDRKKDEPGLLEFAKKHRLPFLTYSADSLNQISGDFSSSAFVEEQLGVDNVCERAAVAASGESGKLIIRKYAENGITVAIAEKKWSVSFNEI
ncbi:cobalt-precorrin 5A hydrolase [Caproiciproducens faecalis]|uniref:Cobalt-precorrin 5A hydrolase n=1 Tax=Caproiciproducens faecalis TaxID=2820301 RepID=A0ABS7DJ23_9FIRM|nr:cobalt-precorrin 5A hydrolase [Caproiciproducens faecalis]MBW7571285.1 cobalt-precorrin 5A hydrolase [Caproiciproducens faecalis]